MIAVTGPPRYGFPAPQFVYASRPDMLRKAEDSAGVAPKPGGESRELRLLHTPSEKSGSADTLSSSEMLLTSSILPDVSEPFTALVVHACKAVPKGEREGPGGGAKKQLLWCCTTVELALRPVQRPGFPA